MPQMVKTEKTSELEALPQGTIKLNIEAKCQGMYDFYVNQAPSQQSQELYHRYGQKGVDQKFVTCYRSLYLFIYVVPE